MIGFQFSMRFSNKSANMIPALALWTCMFNAMPLTSSLALHPRIINGTIIKIEDAPYQVSLYFFEHFCGGSIISREHVLTAAHCIDYRILANLAVVRSGSTYWSRDAKQHEIVQFWIHEDFDDLWMKNDVALLKVSPPFEIDNSKTKIVELFDEDEEVEIGVTGLVTGWGYYERNNFELSQQLRGLNVTVVDTNSCRQVYAGESYNLNDHQFCASVPGVERDFCNGDSGGPLVIDGRQAGIVSWSGGDETHCVLPDQPGVYTAVSHYRNWIDQHMKY